MQPEFKTKVSFVIPVFNTEDFLIDCLDSILEDKDVDTEIIVVSDASPGNCDAIIEQYPMVKYIKFEQNSSQFQARLAGIKCASGKYICFIDSDDYYQNPEFKVLCEEMETTGADFVIFDTLTGDPNAPTVFSDAKGKLRDTQIFSALCKSEMRWNLCDKLFRTEQIQKIISTWETKGLYMNMCDDYALFACVAYEAKLCIRSQSKTTYFYRENLNSVTRKTKVSKDKILQHLDSYKDARTLSLNYIKTAGATKSQIKQLDNLHFWNMTWYFDTYIKGNRYEDKSEIYFSFLESFNRDLAINFLLKSDFAGFCDCIQKNKQKFISKKKVYSIGIVVSSLGGGGTERVAVNLANLFQEENYKVTLITSSRHANEYKVNSGIKRYLVKGINGERFIKFKEICDIECIDTLIFVDYYLSQTFIDIVWARLNAFHVVAMEHNMFFVPSYTNTPVYYSRRLKSYKLTDALTCLSSMDLFAWQFSGVNNVFYVPNQGTFSIRTSVNRSLDRKKRIIFIGRLCEEKGIHFLPKLVTLIKNHIPEIHLDILGTFSTIEDEQILKKSIKQRHLEENISLIGHTTDVEKYYASASVHLMLSKFEGYPMVMLEAKAYGLPSVIFDMPYLTGSSEREGCIQVPYGDVEEMATRIIRLLNNSEEWNTYSKLATDSLALSSRSLVLNKWKEIFSIIENNVSFEKVKTSSFETEAYQFMHEFYKIAPSLGSHQIQNQQATHSMFVESVITMANMVLPLHSRRRKLVRHILQKLINMFE